MPIRIKGLRFKFGILVMISIFLGVSATSVMNYSIFREETVNTFIVGKEGAINNISNEINNNISQAFNTAGIIRIDRNVANFLSFGNAFFDSVRNLLSSTQMLLSDASNISLVDMEGKVRAYSNHNPGSISEENYIAKVRENDIVMMFTPHPDYPFSKNFVVAAQVMRGVVNCGFAVVSINLQEIWENEVMAKYGFSLQDMHKQLLSDKYGLSRTDELMLFDENDQLALYVGNKEQNHMQIRNDIILETINQNQDQSVYIESDEDILFFSAIPSINGHVVLRCLKSSMYAPINRMINSNVLIYILIFCLALLCTYLLTRAIIPRLQQGVDFAQEVISGNISGHLDEGDDELGVMFSAFNFMVTHFDRLVKERTAEQNRQLQEILDSSPTAMLITRHGVVKKINNNGSTMFGLSAGDSSLGIYTHDDQYVKALYAVETECDVRNWPIDTRGADGAQLDALITMYPFVFEGEKSLLIWITDVTEQTRAKIMAETASKAKSTFLANMSHEIRTPLNAVIGLSEIELRNDLNAKTHDNLEKIYRSGSILLGIINDILDVSKIESGKFQLVTVKYYFANLVSDTIHQNVVRIAGKPITFEPDIDENTPSQFYGDEVRIRQILTNLLTNAFKYTDEGKVTLSVNCERLGDGAKLEFMVSDTGRGIKEEDFGKLFSEYSNLGSWENRRIEGTGLGLSICKSLVEMMDGKITAESEYGKGSSFKVVIYQAIADPTPIGKETAKNLRTFQLIKSRRDQKLVRRRILHGKVLIVDDVQTNLDVAKGLLTPYALTVHCASSGRRAIEAIRDGNATYDMIFMDHMMPEMDGIETLKVIREIGTEYTTNVPIVVLTANALVGNEKFFLENGFQDFLSKPIDVMKLDTIINKWIPYNPDLEEPPSQDTDMESLDELDSLGGFTPSEWMDFGIDIKEGAQRYGLAPYLQIIHSYITHTPALLDKLRGLSEESLSDYAVTVHGIKGSSYGVSAHKIGNLAEALEKAAKEGNFNTVMRGNEAFLKETEALLLALSPLRESLGGKSAAKEHRAAPDKDTLRELLDACSKYNISAIEDAMGKLESFTYDMQFDLVQWLGVQLENLEYDIMRQRLEAVLKNSE